MGRRIKSSKSLKSQLPRIHSYEIPFESMITKLPSNVSLFNPVMSGLLIRPKVLLAMNIKMYILSQ